MKSHLQQLISASLANLQERGELPPTDVAVRIDHTRDKSHGDFASNIAMLLTKIAKRKPRDIAELIIDALPSSEHVAKVEVAGPGFINFFVTEQAFHSIVPTILEQGTAYGRSNMGAGKRVQVEFVSANPTGPLHVGHGRGAAYGATVADLLAAIGFDVHREYYVNDAGRQMDILASSVWLRYLELCGEELPFPSNGYQGDYVWDIAASIHREHGDALRHTWNDINKDIPADAPGGDKEAHIDGLIARAKELLRDDQYRLVFDLALNTIVDDIRDDLTHFGVMYDAWYSERSLTDSGAVMRAIERLQTSGHCYEQAGAVWFRSSDFGDEKDRVLVRDNGQTTYFASDIAYHMDKLERGFERVIDVWGADHHGYVPRVKAALLALGDEPNKLDVLLVQFAVLYRGGEKVQMSTRSGEFVTLRQLRKEVGKDAARFFYVMRKCEQHLDFDIDLAKSQTSDNPVFYIQYAHARICNVFRKLQERGFNFDAANGIDNLQLLTEPHELALMNNIARYPEVLETAAVKHDPHQLAHYLRELATDLHAYYDTDNKRITILVDDAALRDARLVLISTVKQVIANGLELIGVSAPEQM